MTLSTFEKLFQEYQESGLNVKDFCSNQGFAPSTFYYWKKQLGKASQYEPGSFVPLVFDSNLPVASRRTIQASINSSGIPGNHTLTYRPCKCRNSTYFKVKLPVG